MNEIKIKEDFARKSSLGAGGKKEGGEDSLAMKGDPIPDWKDVPLEGFDNGLTESRTFKRNKG